MAVTPSPAVPAPLNTEALRKNSPAGAHRERAADRVSRLCLLRAQPHALINAMTRFYETTHANVHRGVYVTAEESTTLYERARVVAGRFIRTPYPAHEIVFTKNTTESLNLVAQSWGRGNLRAGDAVLLTEMEHHSNIVPWMILAEELGGLDIRYIPVDGDGRLVLDDLDRLVDGVKAVAVSAMSNVLGTINPIRHIAAVAHGAGAVVIADGARWCRTRRSTSPSWGSTSSPSRRTRPWGPPGSACCGDAPSSWRPWARSSEAGA